MPTIASLDVKVKRGGGHKVADDGQKYHRVDNHWEDEEIRRSGCSRI